MYTSLNASVSALIHQSLGGIAGYTIALFHNYFFPTGEHPKNLYYQLISRTTNCLLYRNISQILLPYNVLGYYSRFDSMKCLEVYYWYVKMPRCGYVEHGLEYLSFYVQKYIAYLTACSGSPAGSQRATRGTRISKTRLLGVTWIPLHQHTSTTVWGKYLTQVLFSWKPHDNTSSAHVH